MYATTRTTVFALRTRFKTLERKTPPSSGTLMHSKLKDDVLWSPLAEHAAALKPEMLSETMLAMINMCPVTSTIAWTYAMAFNIAMRRGFGCAN